MELDPMTRMMVAAKQQILLYKATHIDPQKDCKDPNKWCNNRLRMLDNLYNIAVELDARERSSNIVVDDLSELSWDDVCDLGIAILEGLKEPWRGSDENS